MEMEINPETFPGHLYLELEFPIRVLGPLNSLWSAGVGVWP